MCLPKDSDPFGQTSAWNTLEHYLQSAKPSSLALVESIMLITDKPVAIGRRRLAKVFNESRNSEVNYRASLQTEHATLSRSQ